MHKPIELSQLKLRAGKATDAEKCGAICYEAFKLIAEQHGFPPDFPSLERGTQVMNILLNRPDVYSVVAEQDGRIVGSNFLALTSTVGGIGPISVDPSIQDSGVGRRLMEDAIDFAKRKKMSSLRLVQAAFHNRTMSLYTKLGFDVKEPLSVLQGEPLNISIDGYHVRLATADDADACAELHFRVHGYMRIRELQSAIQMGNATVVEHDGRISGYSTMIGYYGHTVGETNEDLKALIGFAKSFPGPGFLLPSRNGDLFRWCLQHKLKLVFPVSLMSMGFYNEPNGKFLPSILF